MVLSDAGQVVSDDVKALVVRLLFLPTLAYNMVLSRLLPRWRWWDRVDDNVILGALPLRRHLDALQALGVGAVVNTCVEYDGPVADHQRREVRILHIPTVDFSPPTLDDVEKAVAFIEQQRRQGATVYVHCKAGRGRNATIALCWLVYARGMSPLEAQAHLETVRPHVNRSLHRRAVVQAYFERLTQNTGSRA